MPLQLARGDSLGDYRILEVLGQGGFAWVYRVDGPHLSEPAALKVSLEPIHDPAAARRALREISVLRSLTNNHVVRVHDAGRDRSGHVFILMDELEGSQLDVWHDFDRAMPPGQALWVVHQACLGLVEAHSRGIVHRDIKPENIWVEPDQNVKVIDFGLARAWDAQHTIGVGLTLDGTLVGTPRYIQPEQIHGSNLTPASDVYSLTTILYELLTGHSVYFADAPFSEVRERFRDEPVIWIAAHVRQPIVPLAHHAVSAALPESVNRLIARGLAKDPAHRFVDARALGNAVGEILHRDLRAALGGTLRIHRPGGGHNDQLLVPGSHRIGRGTHCEVVLASTVVADEHVAIEWSGVPYPLEVYPISNTSGIQIGGRDVTQRTCLKPGQTLELGGYGLEVLRPPV